MGTVALREASETFHAAAVSMVRAENAPAPEISPVEGC
jgi:hypothetical protein